jgi:chromosome segregation ATPase
MSTILEPPMPTKSSLRIGWLWTALALVALLVLWALYAHFTTHAVLASQLQEAGSKLAALDNRANTLEQRLSETKAQLAAASASVAQTRENLEQARTLAQHTRDEQRRLTQRFGGHVVEQQKELGTLSGEVGAVKGEVADSRRDLQRAIGDLGEQSGLIARNHDELQTLKRLGEREYIEFRLSKSQGLTRVGPLSLRLNKTDSDRQKYTLTVLVDDKQIEKKDKTLLEPVQFYLPQSRSLREIVVYELGEDEVEGYVSLPKEVVALK